jgi:hypothetical protein
MLNGCAGWLVNGVRGYRLRWEVEILTGKDDASRRTRTDRTGWPEQQMRLAPRACSDRKIIVMRGYTWCSKGTRG